MIANPFAELSTTVPAAVMQAYVGIMVVLVVAGTLFDIVHKKSAAYFFGSWRHARDRAARRIGGREMVSLALRTVAFEGLGSGEFCDPRRRIAHLLTMYGFLAYVVATVVMVFWYPTPATLTPAFLPQLWYLGALLVCVGGGWFWFFIRVDVLAEGHSRFRVVRADLFVLSLLASALLGLVWAILQAAASAWAGVFLALYLIATTVLFASVPWSKFSHMFFKPAAAFQKRVEDADGSRANLPAPAEGPEIFGSARERPRHY